MSTAYPHPTVPLPASRVRTPSGATAETLVLVALVLEVIGGVLVLAGIGYLFGFSLLNPFPYAWAALVAGAAVAVVVVAFLYLAYTLSYQRIQRGEYLEAQAPTLVLGILSLLLGVVPGIFYIVAYVKLGDALREAQGPVLPPAAPMPPGVSAGGGSVACRGCGRVYGLGQFAFCPACGQKLAP